MKKLVQEKPHIAGIIVFFLFAFFVAFLFFPTFSNRIATEEQRVFKNSKGNTWTLPSGVYTFSVASASESVIKFLKGEIDPPDVHVGDVQSFMIEVTAPTGIKSVTAVITTDTKTQNVELSDAGNNIWRGSWTVEDTHDTRYITRFVAIDNSNNEDFFDIAWSDACGIALSGNWSIATNNGGASCTISSVDGVDNGNVAIDANATLTVNGTFVWNSGKSISLSNGGKIIIGVGGKIQQGDLYMSDADSDGYPADSTQSTTGGAGMRRKSALTSFSLDCNNSDGTMWQLLTGYPDADGDGRNSPSGSQVCAGASLPVARQTAGTDCNDGNASVWQTHYGYQDYDGDGVVGSDYINVCGGASNPLYGSSGSDCDDYNASYSYYGTVYYDGDQDGYGSWSTSLCANGAAYYPYTTTSGDCNDSNAAIYISKSSCRTDGDSDGYTTGSAFTACMPSGNYYGGTYCGTSLGTDCDDTSAGVWQIVQKYLDSDHDGYGTGILQPFCVGYAGGATDCLITGWCSNNNSDCNDSNASITTGSTYYRDADNDGYGVATPTTTACSQPAGYASNTSDCNDGSASYNVNNCVSGTLTGGTGAQGTTITGGFTVTQNTSNGYGPINTSAISGLPSGTTCSNYPSCGPSSYYNVPTGGTTNHPVGFIIPSNAPVGTYNISMSASLGSESTTMSGTIVVTQGCTTGYRDYDKDGYGTGTQACYTPDAAYNIVANNSDCNDSNASIGVASNLYYDDDGDGYGMGPANLRCPGGGWVTTNTDCIDNYTVQYSDLVHPNSGYYTFTGPNGWDWDCSGTTDKHFTSNGGSSCSDGCSGYANLYSCYQGGWGSSGVPTCQTVVAGVDRAGTACAGYYYVFGGTISTAGYYTDNTCTVPFSPASINGCIMGQQECR